VKYEMSKIITIKMGPIREINDMLCKENMERGGHKINRKVVDRK
jgi:hypothetical protein